MRVVTLAETMLIGEWPAERSASILVRDVAEVLTAHGRVPGFEMDGIWHPILEDGGQKARAAVEADWKRRADTYETAKDDLTQKAETASATENFRLSHLLEIETTNCARALVRCALRTLGMKAKEASEFLPGKKRTRRDRLVDDLVSFTAERIEWADGARLSTADLAAAFKEWYSAAGRSPSLPGDESLAKFVVAEFKDSAALRRPKRMGSDGNRYMGFVGMRLKPQTGNPGDAARVADENFLRALRSPALAERYEIARTVQEERTARARGRKN